MSPWYLLFDGESTDGRGTGQYIGRTTDMAVAKRHYEKCARNPYSTGRVEIITDSTHERAGPWTNWEK